MRYRSTQSENFKMHKNLPTTFGYFEFFFCFFFFFFSSLFASVDELETFESFPRFRFPSSVPLHFFFSGGTTFCESESIDVSGCLSYEAPLDFFTWILQVPFQLGTLVSRTYETDNLSQWIGCGGRCSSKTAKPWKHLPKLLD